ncbi:hypothetical protein DFQ03_0129 [Maribacter caenipelagi]|uniref:Fibronectin type-III domain-containing protein n=1 Tax=Maribacter caenipelagi TaxID=1447781 RepID=A0A4R7DGY7_9FLAO|nr:hypothetical protein [Maribacter caenipelagi]TDS20873.1 hypothetical protein DFQ03_0129 [Maribacter caenipelagi]
MRCIYSFLLVGSIVFLASCEEILEVPDISEEEVVLLAPSDSSVVTQTEINFTWQEVFEATSYHVQIAQPSFTNASQIVADTLVVVDSTYIGSKITRTLLNNSYEWRVKAQNSDFETPYTTNSFTVN